MPEPTSAENPTSSVDLTPTQDESLASSAGSFLSNLVSGVSSGSTAATTTDTPEPQTDGGDFNTGAASISDANESSSTGGGLFSSSMGEKTV